MPETSKPKKSHGRTAADHPRFPRWARHLTATAAVLAILICGSITAKAFGFNIWKAVVQWTQETFQFGEWGNSNKNNDLPYASLQEALKNQNISAQLVPSWFPDGYELVDIVVEHSPLQTAYKAKYINGEQSLIITIQDYLDKEPFYAEQSEGLVEEYEVAGITYYFCKNNERTQVAWFVDSIECHIWGQLPVEELKLMVDSIGKG